MNEFPDYDPFPDYPPALRKIALAELHKHNAEKDAGIDDDAPSEPRTAHRKKSIKAKRHHYALPVAVVSNSVESIKLKSKKAQAESTLDLCSLNAMRTAIGLLFRVKAKTDKRFWTFRTTCYELSRSLGLHYNLGRKQAEDLLHEVASIVFTIRKDKKFAAIPVTAIAELDEDSGLIRLKLNKELQPYLLDLQRDYRKLHRRALQLRSPRTLLLYQLLRRFVGLDHPRHRVSMVDLQRAMQSKRVPWKEFRRFHLDPAIKDINRRTEVGVSYRVKRRGAQPDRKRGEVEALIFNVRERPKIALVETAPLTSRNSSPTSRNSTPSGRNGTP